MAKNSNTSESGSQSINEKYLTALKQIDSWTTVYDWALKVGELFPELLEKANAQAKQQKRPSTGIREIAARISSRVSTGGWAGTIEVDTSERPRRVRLLSPEAARDYVALETEEDLEPISRNQKIRADEAKLSTKDQYRVAEFDAIATQIKAFFGLDFECDHAKALLNPTEPGDHHPDNLQLLLKAHNRTKSHSNWTRFTLEEQIEYIHAAVRLQRVVAKRMDIDLQEDVITALIERVRAVY